MDNHFEHCTAHVTSLEQDGFLIKIHAQVPSDSGVSGRELLSRVDQISGHLRRVKCCDRISRGQLAFARIEDNFHRVRALGDDVEGRVAVRFIDYGREDVLLLSDIIIVDPPLSDVLTTIRPLAEDFYLDGILLMRPLSNEEIVVLSEKILYRTVSCRLRRLHPELSLIELASTNAAGDRPELFSNIVIELGFGNKCTSEDIANYLRIKIPARSEESAMQPARGFGGSPFSVPPPNILGSQPTTILGHHSSNMLGQQHTTVHGSQPAILMSSQPTQSHPSVNSRLSKFKKDAALNMGPGVNLYNQTNSPPPQLADRKQYTVTDGRTCTTAPTLPVKSTHNAYISHVEDGPFSFTIQLKSSVEELLPKLRNILVRYQNSPITAQLIPGSVVMAKSSDETLKRGVIMNVQPETCKVYYIDYGNFEELPYTDIFQLPNTAAELSPAMAMQFCLADLKSMKITDSNKDYFARLLLGKQILIRVTERESNSPFQYCEILWEGRNVREILLNLNSPMQYSYQYPPRGREAPVSVIYVDGPSQFFVQYRSELNVANQIQEALATYCPSQPRVSDLSAINIGSPVASIFPDDQRWYRALVMGMDNCNINVFYVDYGNRAEVNPNQICLLSRDLVNKWKTQAIECCLIGFDTVTPDLFMAEKMEDATLGHSYTLRLHSILSGFRLSVDLLDDQGNSIATKMKNLLNERQKSINHPLPSTEKNKPQASHDEDRASQHSSDSGGKMNKFQRPGTRGDKVGNKPDQHGDKKFDNRNKFEARPNSYSQHDDRSGNDYKPRNDTRSDWKKGAKKPYMDQENEWGDNSNQEPKPYAKKESWGEKQNSGGAFKKQEWATDDKPARGGDRGSRPDRGERQGGGFRSDGDRQSGNKFERKPYNINDDARSGNRGPRDHKFGDRDNKFGDRENKFGDRENKFGDRDNRFADRDGRYGRDNNRENNRFGGRDNKFGDKPNNRDERKPKWNEPGAVKSTVADQGDSWDDAGVQPSVKRPSVVISEYPHQEIKIGQDYKVLFAGMETSPRDIYVQLSDCDSELDKIRSIIDADATATSRPISKAVLAMPVLARFQDDGLLYRATIRSITKVPSGQVDVLFVDFGNTAVNALSEVFTISSELMSIPIQAIHVIVSDMPTTPFPNLSACQAHFETDYLTLKPSRTTTINLEQVIEGKVIHPDGNSVADLIKNDPSCLREPQAIVESLRVEQTSVDVIENDPPGLGETQAVVESQEVEQAPVVLWRERLDFLLGQQLRGKVVKKLEGNNTYSIKITAVLDLIVPAQSVHQLSSGLNQGDDIIVSVEGLTEDKLLVKYYNRRGQSFGEEAAISWIIPMQIVERKGVYTMSHRESATIYLQRDNTATMTDLIDRLFEKYEGSTPDVYEFKVGDICVAKSFDGNWYRAKISAAVENNFTVHYIDYGNKEEIKVENLRKLDDEFNSPAMCVGVVLPVAIKDVDVCLEGVGDGPFDCTFIKRDIEKGVWIVDLETLSELGENKKNLALKFIDEGKAEPNLYSDISADPVRRGPSWNLKKANVYRL
ncbi:hypothetical protein GE061_017545 [Apolygus lucorum]|uniref:Tudor domain-containing protein n=1 Tax=Apolygus lucorum TaxID=248454 RepID=A0A8S9XCP9_APOLU|nr:hypothetical protein GE061_017545 [Apolygus lucorum]